jgi:hypothetical protein
MKSKDVHRRDPEGAENFVVSLAGSRRRRDAKEKPTAFFKTTWLFKSRRPRGFQKSVSPDF